jgi:hypothetical protein
VGRKEESVPPWCGVADANESSSTTAAAGESSPLLHGNSGDGAARELLTLDDIQRSPYSNEDENYTPARKSLRVEENRLLRGQLAEQEPLTVDNVSFETTFQEEEKRTTRLALIISNDRLVISFINLAWVLLRVITPM